MAKTKYTCSYQLVFAITTVNFVIMCYFLKITDQVDCQLYLHSYLIFFTIVQTAKIVSILQRRQNAAKSRKVTEVTIVCISSVQFLAKPVFNFEISTFSKFYFTEKKSYMK